MAGGLRSSAFFGDGDHGNFEQPVPRPTQSAKIAMKNRFRQRKFLDGFFHRMTGLFDAEIGFNLLDSSVFKNLFGAFVGDGSLRIVLVNVA